ncbi:MAG: BrnT family toxin [Cyanobacteria bacterium P01_A01_bin.123]
MDIEYRLEDFEFEWNESKAQTNFAKHGVTFIEAAEAFLDPFYVVGDASVNKEEREFVLGYSLAERLLLVVHIERGARIRIISARLATRTERRLYEQYQ